MEKDNLLNIDIEVLHEAAAGLFADFMQYTDRHHIPDDDQGPVMTVANQVFALWQRAAAIETRQELDRFQGGLDFARNCLKTLEEADCGG